MKTGGNGSNSGRVSMVDDILGRRLWDTEAIKARLVAGEDASAQDRGGYTPLIAAARDLGVEAVAVLLSAGARLDGHLSEGKNALHMAAMGQTKPAVLEMLMRAGLDPNTPDEQGRTALHYAAMYAKGTHGWIVASLLGFKADPFVKDPEGLTPRDVAETPEARAILKAVEDKSRAG